MLIDGLGLKRFLDVSTPLLRLVHSVPNDRHGVYGAPFYANFSALC
jgi:hypothetical protein